MDRKPAVGRDLIEFGDHLSIPLHKLNRSIGDVYTGILYEHPLIKIARFWAASGKAFSQIPGLA